MIEALWNRGGNNQYGHWQKKCKKRSHYSVISIDKGEESMVKWAYAKKM